MATVQGIPQDDTAEGAFGLIEGLKAIIGELENEALDRVAKRTYVEQRWLEDLSQYHGRYDEKIEKSLENEQRSTLFINQTRPKTNSMEARLSDMLFPTDDRNWGISSTPVPSLTSAAEEAAKQAAKIATDQMAGDDPAAQQQLTEVQARHAQFQAEIDEGKKRAAAMELDIDDSLREAKYAVHCRDVIRDACKIGTGVIKGPITDGHSKRMWNKGKGANVYELQYEKDETPLFWRVDPWNFFPDSDAASMDDNEAVFERHLFNPKQIRRLARLPGFDKEALRRLLANPPRTKVPSYLSDLRSITGTEQDMSDRYTVWEYHGPLTASKLQMMAEAMGRSADIKGMFDDKGDIDPLEEISVVVWFCDGEALKFGIHHLDSADPIYSVFNLEKDETTMFGFGVPYIMRDPQKALAAAWRILMDNMGLSSGPQVVINTEVVTPVNGEYTMTGRKFWIRQSGAPPNEKPFEVFDIPSHMEELTGVINLSRQNIDEETAMPMIAQGEQGAQVTKTAQGMGILMNSVNVVFRRIVKNWDDDVTTPNIRRMYDYKMQFSENEDIKGDYQVDARGSSVLLVREIQSGNLMIFVDHFSGHPVLGKYLKEEGLPALRRLAQTMMIPADEVIKTDTEVRADEVRRSQGPPQVDPEIMKLESQMNLEKMRGENALQLERARRETALIQLASQQNMKLDELRAMLRDKQADRDSKERIQAVEAAVSERDGAGGGGYF